MRARDSALDGSRLASAAPDPDRSGSTSDRRARARASRSRERGDAWRTSEGVALRRLRPAGSTSSRAGSSRGAMVEREPLVLIRERPPRLQVEAAPVDDEPAGAVAVEDREIAGAEEAQDRDAA